MTVTMKDGNDTITFCRCGTCKKDAQGQGSGLVWVWEKKRNKWVRGWPIGLTG